MAETQYWRGFAGDLMGFLMFTLGVNIVHFGEHRVRCFF